jgi:hypothetical protein
MSMTVVPRDAETLEISRDGKNFTLTQSEIGALVPDQTDTDGRAYAIAGNGQHFDRSEIAYLGSLFPVG